MNKTRAQRNLNHGSGWKMERNLNKTSPYCEKCGSSMAAVGKLPEIGFRPSLQIYKCTPCRSVVAVSPCLADHVSASAPARRSPTSGNQT